MPTAPFPCCIWESRELQEQADKNAHQQHVQCWEQHGFTSVTRGLLPQWCRQGGGRQGNLPMMESPRCGTAGGDSAIQLFPGTADLQAITFEWLLRQQSLLSIPASPACSRQ